MTYMDKAFASGVTAQDNDAVPTQGSRVPVLVIIEDGIRLSSAFSLICECLGIAIQTMPSCDDLGPVLRGRRPMAVIAEMDGAGQDGCHVLMTIATHDRTLPVLLITGPDAALLGAADAVEEIWALRSVEKWPQLLGVGAAVDFLFRAGRKGNCMRLMSI